MLVLSKPDRSESAEYYFNYIDQVGPGDIRPILAAQLPDALAVFARINEATSLHRPTPDRWTSRQVLNHINDAERLFVFRAFWFTRGFDTPLPGFDQNVAIAAARPDDRTWASHVEEFRSIRAGTLTFFNSLADADWDCRGVASDCPFSVRALAYITAGHVAHHLKFLRERFPEAA